MDLSALIFVALAVAWAAYLIPVALRHHDEVVRSRSVDRFSDTMRVLARREPVSRRDARLVVTPGRPASQAIVVAKPSAAAGATLGAAGAEPVDRTVPVRREAAARAARRRRRVLGGVLVLNVLVLALAAFGVVSWWLVTGSVTLLAGWLVACRLMVRHERGLAPAATSRPAGRMPIGEPQDQPQAPAHTGTVQAVVDPETHQEVEVVVDDATGEIVAVAAEGGLWDPVPVTLPTYVTKPAATRRTVRTIDLDDSGVWTSGRTDADSALAREAEAAERAEKAVRTAGESRAVGS